MSQRRPLQEVVPNLLPSQRPKLGPKPKPLSQRACGINKPPVKNIQRTYSDKKRLEVLAYLAQHQVYSPLCGPGKRGDWRPVTIHEASVHFNISPNTIKHWKKRQNQILSRERVPTNKAEWPELESELFQAFLTQRSNNKICTVWWFRRKAQAIFTTLYPDSAGMFLFSNGWWAGFRNRHNISRRRITKQATKRPEQYVEIVNLFLRFIRRVSNFGRSHNINKLCHMADHLRRFALECILNIDETPVPFEFLDGSTYDIRGQKTIAAKSDRSGWNKRQATLILYIFADGVQRLKPKLIFHGSPTGPLYEEEKPFYSSEVTVEFNSTAYNNEESFLRWIRTELADILHGKEHLLVMDVASFHKTESVLKELKDRGVTPAMIPPGCTSML